MPRIQQVVISRNDELRTSSHGTFEDNIVIRIVGYGVNMLDRLNDCSDASDTVNQPCNASLRNSELDELVADFIENETRRI
jgi:hypothetical protein